MTYPVVCECGATTQVPGSAAGTTVACPCGRAIQVPSLARLKNAASESAASADLQLEHLTRAGRLPLEAQCVVCGRDTDDTITCDVVCERTEVKDTVPWWQQAMLLWLSFWLYLMQMATRRVEVHGRDVQFRLPIRVCPPCAQSATGAAGVRELLARTPLYADLLRKYPHAKVTRIG